MWALIENEEISRVYTRPTALTIGDTQYPSNIMDSWTASELEAIGIYAVVEDNTNLKDAVYYNNGLQSFVFENDTVTKRFGVASAKDLDDVLWTQEDIDLMDPAPEGISVGDLKRTGLKKPRKARINSRANTMLATYDWYTIRAASGGTAVPAAITTYQTAVRLRSNEHATTIDAVSTVDELAALTYAWPDDPVV